MENVKVRIEIDEVWPIYSLFQPKEDERMVIEVPEQLFNEYQIAASEFERIQRELHRLYESVKEEPS